jgi:hypothetical protein
MFRHSFALAGAVALLLSGCASFFEEPIDTFDPPPSNAVPGSSDAGTTTAPTAPRSQARDTPPVTAEDTNSQPGYFTIATFDQLDKDYARLAFVHLTNLGANRDTNRELALCQAVRRQYTATPVDQVPAGVNLLVWPVHTPIGEDVCLEMLTKYDPVDIRQSTAAKVKDLATGPFLLARGGSESRRMIYDMSNLQRSALPAALRAWGQVFKGPLDRWPEYRYAR